MYTSTSLIKLCLIFTIIHNVKTLECGIRINKNEELKEIMNQCLMNNKTMDDLWDMTSTSSESDEAPSSSEETSRDDKMLKYYTSRTKRTVLRSAPLSYKEENETQIEGTSTEKPEEAMGENCAIQCIFNRLEMTDSSGYPEHNKVLDNLMKKATGTEFRDFIQDSVDECFQDMDKESGLDSCDYSIKIMECLADKGRSNCADWPIGNIPLNKN